MPPPRWSGSPARMTLSSREGLCPATKFVTAVIASGGDRAASGQVSLDRGDSTASSQSTRGAKERSRSRVGRGDWPSGRQSSSHESRRRGAREAEGSRTGTGLVGGARSSVTTRGRTRARRGQSSCSRRARALDGVDKKSSIGSEAQSWSRGSRSSYSMHGAGTVQVDGAKEEPARPRRNVEEGEENCLRLRCPPLRL